MSTTIMKIRRDGGQISAAQPRENSHPPARLYRPRQVPLRLLCMAPSAAQPLGTGLRPAPCSSVAITSL